MCRQNSSTLSTRRSKKIARLRYQHASDMRADLKRLKRETDSGRSGTTAVAASDSRPPSSTAAVVAPSLERIAARAEIREELRRESEAAHASGSSVVAAAKQHKGALVGGVVVALVVLLAAGYGVYSLLANRTVTIPFQTFDATQVTNSGKAAAAAISPDGKYVVSVINDNGKQSLWLRNVPSGSNTQVLEPDPFVIQSAAFSPDGNYIFLPQGGGYHPDLIPAVSNAGARRLRRNFCARCRLRPNLFAGRQAHGVHTRRTIQKPASIVSFPRIWMEATRRFSRIAPLPDPDNLSWSPDGKRIAFISYSQSNAQGQISTFEIASGKDTPLTSFPDKVFTDLAWTPDGRGLLVNYRSSGATNRQIGFVSYPSGRFQSLTNDTRGYRNAEPFWRRQGDGLDSAARDGFSLCSPRQQRESLWRLPDLPNQAEVQGVDWDSQGDLLVTTTTSILRMSPDGSRQTTLLSDPSLRRYRWSSACSRGGPILFARIFGKERPRQTSGASTRMGRIQNS